MTEGRQSQAFRRSSGIPEAARRRLEHLYEISTILTQTVIVDEAVPTIARILAQSLPLLSVVMVQGDSDSPRTTVWSAPGEDEARLEVAIRNASRAFGYLTHDVAGEPEGSERHFPESLLFIALPVVVKNRPIFGAFQVEGKSHFDELDLVFVNAVVNQLAVALDRQAIIEARQAAEARHLESLQAASRRREDLLGMVSHDLRNQLGSVKANTDLWRRNAMAAGVHEGTEKYADAIHRATNRMLHLLGDLLDFASIEAGRLLVELDEFEAGLLVKEAVSMGVAQAEVKGISLKSIVSDAHILVVCDKNRISQVFSNLIGNAIKFTGQGGTITVRAEQDGRMARLSVCDTGSGIPAGDLPYIFDRYWRGKRGSSLGSGLGLAIARGIVETHGGKIWAESQVGLGTTVYFWLPLASDTASGSSTRGDDTTRSG